MSPAVFCVAQDFLLLNEKSMPLFFLASHEYAQWHRQLGAMQVKD